MLEILCAQGCVPPHNYGKFSDSVIQKDGLNFVSLYFKIRTSDKYDINYIPTTNAVPRWRLNVETKTKRTLHSSRRLSFNELNERKKSCAA